MGINIRRGVFETNSSSCHSISIKGDDHYRDDFNGEGRDLEIELGEFGWGPDLLEHPFDKLCYVLVSIQYFQPWCKTIADLVKSKEFIWLQDIIREKINYNLVVEENSGKFYPLGYIDHDSKYLLEDLWSDNETVFKDNMREFIFNNKYNVIIDNDN